LQVMEKIQGELKTLLSADSLVDDDPNESRLRDPAAQQNVEYDRSLITVEELNLFCPPGFPDHQLYLKVGAIAILIRNLDVRAGLVNGTRLLINEISHAVITCEVLSGNDIVLGKTVYVPRIPFVDKVSDMIKMERLQFPLRPAFCLTFNKCQGQTLDKVRIVY
jgi:hypothetical protein